MYDNGDVYSLSALARDGKVVNSIHAKTTTVAGKPGYITVQLRVRDNLPGTEDTVIK